MTPWVRHTLVAYCFNTSCRIPGIGLSNSAVVERSIPACTSRPTAGRSRIMPEMFGIQASIRCLGQRRKDAPEFVGYPAAKYSYAAVWTFSRSISYHRVNITIRWRQR
ncbi:hypothetical protein M405DRAFT_814084 [Rhizopogon salebrosus TDB-379]|nr:hypothetical protein M405DRAFT_814084 [Rhizopogon salebrosus TDB-379]